jgi:hypothetical protein
MSFLLAIPSRLKQAQKEFIQVAGIAGFDPKAKAPSRPSNLHFKARPACDGVLREPVTANALMRSSP